MSAPADVGGERSPVSRLLSGLPELIDTLRGADFDVGSEQYLAACDLLLAHAAEDRALAGAELRAMLGGLFCTSADEQQRYADYFDPWYRQVSVETRQPSRPPPPPREEPRWAGRPSTRWTAIISVFLAVAISAALVDWTGIFTSSPAQMVGPGQSPDSGDETDPGRPTAPVTQLSRIPGPQQPPEPVVASPQFYPVRAQWLRLLWLPIVVAWLAIVLKRLLLRQVVLSRRRRGPGEELTLRHLSLAAKPHQGFGTSTLAETWRHLRQFRVMPSRRLNEAATIDRTLEAGGFFQPAYRERQVPPAYLMMVDRRHAEDHAAAIADELAAAMRHENIVVSTCYYNEDPRYTSAPDAAVADRGPAALAGTYADRGLLLVGSTDLLFDAGADQPHQWLQEFGAWERKVMLSTDPLWPDGQRLEELGERGFGLAPLTVAGLGQIPESPGTIAEDDPRDLPLPSRFSFGAGRWLEDRKPPANAMKAALADLRSYLGPDGFTLLVACAAYPALYVKLTLALDAQLELPADSRGIRLRKLARLPWFRHGQMPDYLRRALLRTLRRDDYRWVTGAYHALLENREQRDLSLPVAVPEWQGIRAWLRELLPTRRQPDPLADHVFADVLRGRRPRLAEFALPGVFLRQLGAQRWRGLLLPLASGLVLVPLALWLNAWAWEAWLEPGVQRDALAAMQEGNGAVRVNIVTGPGLDRYGDALREALGERGFRVDGRNAASEIGQSDDKRPGTPNEDTQEPADPANGNTVKYRSGFRAAAERIRNRAAYLYYGVEPALAVATADDAAPPPGVDVSVELRAAPRVFRDRLAFRDRLDDGSPGPRMMALPGGSFLMGSDTNEAGRYPGEGPQYEVTLKRFAIGVTEVTFDDYDRFANATGRDLPRDLGWGRGSRPVTDVDWEDATAYADWLSDQTGKGYRLPSEAEWEYAARAGTETRFWWGDDVGEGRANCNGCGSRWDGEQTAPVGSFAPNAFGLYDTAGNAWEWTQDCWHATYVDAPADGTAWLEDGGGDCRQRVLRGGSWYDEPDFVRSANRFGSFRTLRFTWFGFRLAQDQ